MIFKGPSPLSGHLQFPRGEMKRRWNESCTNLFLWIKILDCWSSSLPENFIKSVQLMQMEGFFRDFVTGQRKKKCYFKKLLCLTAWASMLFCLGLSRWSKRLLNCCESGRLLNCCWKPRGGGRPYKTDGGGHRKFWRIRQRNQDPVLWAWLEVFHS